MEVSGGLEGGFDPPFQRAEKERLAELSTEEAATELLCSSSIKRQEINDLVPNDESHLGKDPADGSLDLADIDDDEVEGYIHNDEEQRYKKIIWEKLNWEYLQEQAAKKKADDAAKEAAAMACNSNASEDEVRAAKALVEAAAAAVAKTRKEKQQKRVAEAKNAGPAQSAVEAARDMLSKKERGNVKEKEFVKKDTRNGDARRKTTYSNISTPPLENG